MKINLCDPNTLKERLLTTVDVNTLVRWKNYLFLESVYYKQTDLPDFTIYAFDDFFEKYQETYSNRKLLKMIVNNKERLSENDAFIQILDEETLLGLSQRQAQEFILPHAEKIIHNLLNSCLLFQDTTALWYLKEHIQKHQDTYTEFIEK